MVDGIIKYKVDYDTESAKKSVNTLGQSVKNVGTNLSNVGAKMTMGLTLPLATIAVSSIKMASDYTENLNKVNVAFGESSKAVVAFSNTSLKSFGIANVTALGMASLFGDMGTAMGQTTDEASKMSLQLVGLAGDLASFKNISTERAQTALAGIYTGETEALKSLGIVMNDQIIQAYLVTKGEKKKWQEMTQSEKVMTRYQFVMENTTKAQGDFARTSDGVANKTRTTTEKIKELQVEIGQKLEPYTMKALDAFNGLLDGFNNLDEDTQNLIGSIGLLAIAIGPASKLVGSATTLGAVLSSPFTMALAAVGLLSFGIYELVTDWDNVYKSLRNGILDINKAYNSIPFLPNTNIDYGDRPGFVNGQWKGVAPKPITTDPKNSIIVPQPNQSSGAITSNGKVSFGSVTVNVNRMDSSTDINQNVNVFMQQITKKLEYGGVFKK